MNDSDIGDTRYCGEGYRIAALTLFENVKITNIELIQFLNPRTFLFRNTKR